MPRIPEPVPGLVIRYSYLWRSDHLAGREDGQKDRPCVVIAAVAKTDDGTVVTVLPITHSPPGPDVLALEMATSSKERLGLDGERSWIVYSEGNRFRWPGPDLRPTRSGNLASIAYGELPAGAFVMLRDRFVKAYTTRRSLLVPRTE